ncbi:hypothetical protein [Sphingomonas nostoxanthinifaciens]|uniref:hypothetical protein n=1 Tax=Sphingomonas nostoxanthinifaciens TaxID=2872652 RepID=UPI001CC20399|nr:hypothetical protein [Sphingomonas nostoxanthinifaciens]UAK24528.1 hypothetical protein K8P63_19855 [Sphingomonas nostoxanthinifaciens]
MRTLYLWFLLAFAIMAYGFSPDLYGGFGPLAPVDIVHGALAVSWMALLVVQSWLIGHGHWRLHGRFGRASRYLTPLLVGSALLVVRQMLRVPSGLSRSLVLTLAWADLVSLVIFSTLYICAIVYRRRMVLHARFMACTVFVVLPPALARAYGPLFHGLRASLQPAYLTVDAAMGALILWDAAHRRFPVPVPLTLAAILFIQTTAGHAPDWPAFVALARLLGLPG